MKRLFEENTICRLCLRVDEKAYKITNAYHKVFIENIIRIKKHQYILPDDLYVCYICKVFLAKFFNFARTVWKTQEIVNVLLNTNTGNTITKLMLERIDRRNNGLNPITLTSVVINGNITLNKNGDDNDSADYGHTNTDIKEVESIDIEKVKTKDIKDVKVTDIIEESTDFEKVKNTDIKEVKVTDIKELKVTDIKELKVTDIEEVEITGIEEVKSIDIVEIESTDIEEVDLKIIVDKMKKNTKKERKKKKQKHKTSEPPNYSSDENEETVTCNLNEEEIEIGKIGKETSDIFVDSLIEDGYDKPRPTRIRKKPERLQIYSKVRKSRLYSIEAKTASSAKNVNKLRNSSDEIDEDYFHDSPSSSTANENKLLKRSDEIDEDNRHDSPSSSTAYENKLKKSSDEIDEDNRHDSPSSSTANENKLLKRSDEIDEDYRHDSPSSSTAYENKLEKESHEIDEEYYSDSTSSSSTNNNKRKVLRKVIDNDYCPDSTSHSEDSDYDSYDDEGKRITRPKDTRVYPMKCDHCDFVLPERRDHYRHYQYSHPDVEYPYRLKERVICAVCGKLVPKVKLSTHANLHLTTENVKCSMCNKVFPNRVKCYKHMRSVHPKKTLTCDYCSKVFKTKTEIHRHIRIHTGIKPYKCHICDEAFAHSGNRLVHIRIRHQNYKDKPKENENPQKKRKNPQKKRKKNKHYSANKEVYDTSDDEPLVKVAKKPQRMSKTPSEDSDVKPKRKCKKKGPIQNGIGESKAES
ncbi:hypothetical protein PYW08_014264 [Mythimna loreyi]|uniref:Uncharacterized protein n=1 Tax=Mythimna loreyi TaxID=667449 RepID=A0ACC2R6W6_9NEOP|nr:hypothetical protein PYW08_014264 [Mythimna loreyi]